MEQGIYGGKEGKIKWKNVGKNKERGMKPEPSGEPKENEQETNLIHHGNFLNWNHNSRINPFQCS